MSTSEKTPKRETQPTTVRRPSASEPRDGQDVLVSLKKKFTFQQSEFQTIKQDVKRRAEGLSQKLSDKESQMRALNIAINNLERETNAQAASHARRENQLAAELASLKDALKASQEHELALVREIYDLRTQNEIVSLENAFKKGQAHEADLAQEIQDSQAQLEINELRGLLKQARDRADKLAREKRGSTLAVELDAAKAAREAAEAQTTKLVDDLARAGAELQAAREDARHQQLVIEQMRLGESHLQEKISLLKHDVQHSEQFLESYEQNLLELQGEVAAYAERLQRAEAHTLTLAEQHAKTEAETRAQMQGEAKANSFRFHKEIENLRFELEVQSAQYQTLVERTNAADDLNASELKKSTEQNQAQAYEIETLRAQTQAHEHQVSELSKRLTLTRAEAESAREERDQALISVDQLQSQCASTTEQLEQAYRENDRVLDAHNQSTLELSKQVDAAHAQYEQSIKDLSVLQEINANLASTLESQADDIELLRAKTARAQDEHQVSLARERQETESLRAANASSQQNVRVLTERVANLDAQLTHANQQLAAAIQTLSGRDQMIANSNRALADAGRNNAELKREINELSGALAGAASERARDGAAANAQNQIWSQRVSHLETQVEDASTARATAEATIHELKQNLLVQDAQNMEDRAQLASLRLELDQREIQLKDQLNQLMQHKSRLDQRQSQLSEQNTQLEQRQAELMQQDAQLQQRFGQLEQRDVRLVQYAAALAAEKAQLSRAAEELTRELQAAQSVSPLKDLLAVTDFELSKLEIQLKTTPTVAPERAKFELAFKQLVEQRDFLRATLNQSQRHHARQLQSLQTLSKSTAAIAVPPPLLAKPTING